MKWIERTALWVSIPFFFLLWQVASMSGLVNELLFPPPTKVAAALWTELINGTLLLDLGMSMMRVVIGFASGAAAAIFVGLLTGRYQLISNFLAPIFQLLRPIPPDRLRADRHPVVRLVGMGQMVPGVLGRVLHGLGRDPPRRATG